MTGRVPWITYALLAACGASFAAAGAWERRVEDAAAASLAEVSAYFLQHPYLEPAPVLAGQLGAAPIENRRRLFQEERDDRGAPPIPPGVQRREQRHLDRLVAELEARLEELPSRRWGLRPARLAPAAFLTHAFLHAGWLHLGGNLLLLLPLGLCLERVWGAAVVAPFLVAAPVASGIAFAAAHPDLTAPLIGASGTVACLLGAYAVRFAGSWRDGAYLLLILLGSGWLALPLWLGWGWPVVPEAAACAESVGGVGFGALAAAAIWLLGGERDRRRAAREANLTLLENPDLDRAFRARAAGRPDQAFTLLSKRVRRDPEDRDASLALWDVAKELGRPGEVVDAMVRVVRDDLQSGNAELAVRHWLDLSEYGIELGAEPALLIRLAVALRNARQPAAAVAALQQALDRPGGADRTVVAARVARVARTLDPSLARAAAWRALSSTDLQLRDRQGLEELLAELEPPPRGEPPQTRVGSLEVPLAETDPAAGEGLGSQPSPGRSWSRPEPIELEIATRRLAVALATPLRFADGGLCVEVAGSGKREIGFDAVDAISVGAVHGLGRKPVILVDLVLNWMTLADEPLQVIRLRSDHFDPRRLAPDRKSAVDALRAFSERLMQTLRATPLPDLQSVEGRPFAVFPDLESYHRDVLMVGDGPVAELTG